MPISIPLQGLSSPPTLAILQAGGIPAILAALAEANNLPAEASQYLTTEWGPSDSAHRAQTAVTNFGSGDPVDLVALDTGLEGCQAALACWAAAIAEARLTIAANPGQIHLMDGGNSTPVSGNPALQRIWPSSP